MKMNFTLEGNHHETCNLRDQYNFFNYKLAAENIFDEGDTITQMVAGIREDYNVIVLSVPLGDAFTQLLASAIDRDIVSQFTITGAALWLVIVVILSIAASWFPVRGATRISVNESLMYQ